MYGFPCASYISFKIGKQKIINLTLQISPCLRKQRIIHKWLPEATTTIHEKILEQEMSNLTISYLLLRPYKQKQDESSMSSVRNATDIFCLK